MRRKPLALLLVGLIVLSALLVGCRKSAVPPVEELTPEEEVTAAIQEAQDNTDAMESPLPTATEPPPSATPEPEATEEPTVAPTATTAPVVQETTTTDTVEPTQEVTEPAAAGTTYVVQPGDNLFRISLRYNVTVQAMAQANNITNPGLIYVGQTLTVPTGGTAPAPSTPSSSCSTVYTVQPGDNLFRIALRYNYSQYYLAQYNGIANPSIVYVGQQICIP